MLNINHQNIDAWGCRHDMVPGRTLKARKAILLEKKENEKEMETERNNVLLKMEELV